MIIDCGAAQCSILLMKFDASKWAWQMHFKTNTMCALQYDSMNLRIRISSLNRPS